MTGPERQLMADARDFLAIAWLHQGQPEGRLGDLVNRLDDAVGPDDQPLAPEGTEVWMREFIADLAGEPLTDAAAQAYVEGRAS